MYSLDYLQYIDRSLTIKERTFINNKLNKRALLKFINLRYPPDPIRYDKMKKKELIEELKYPRYE